jgi:hypothetical protein
MPCGLCLRTLGTLLFANPFLGVSWAQDKPPAVPPFLDGSENIVPSKWTVAGLFWSSSTVAGPSPQMNQ